METEEKHIYIFLNSKCELAEWSHKQIAKLELKKSLNRVKRDHII